jgi:hypothetical protein
MDALRPRRDQALLDDHGGLDSLRTFLRYWQHFQAWR